MYILSECEECGFIWTTMSLSNECAKIDKRRKEMRKQDEENMNEHFRVYPRIVNSEEYPR